ncbi:hypothetical protein [Alkalihalobacterium alkalinitrilicum]|uniref:hypothetical protein n=1 Tax=Alkalihalobacterium alkalinitrilicum TaxID=427920 RepID=UPI0009949072|nr:hypothetical protein [Alkalihalobacterium alkalinitrilicum]
MSKKALVNFLKETGMKEEVITEFEKIYNESVKKESEKEKEQKANEHSDFQKTIADLAQKLNITK